MAISVAACGGGGSAAAPQRPAPTPTPTSAVSLQLPLDAYTLTASQTAADEYLLLFLEKSCMTKLGFPNYPPGLSSSYAAQDARVFQLFNSRLWGVSDPVQAALYGYHLPPWANASGSGSSTGKVLTLADFPAAEREAVLGHGNKPYGDIPAGGCIGQAQREETASGLSGGGQTPALVSQLQQESFDQAKSDPRVLKVFASWSACMKSSGFDYSSPLSMDFNMAKPASSLEIQTAKRDVACKLKTNLLGVTYAVESDYQDKLINSNAQQLAQIQEQVRSEEHALATVEEKYGMS